MKDEKKVCPSCHRIREGLYCNKCGTKLVPLEELVPRSSVKKAEKIRDYEPSWWKRQLKKLLDYLAEAGGDPEKLRRLILAIFLIPVGCYVTYIVVMALLSAFLV